ncbi:MAG: hypothetical protein WC374_10495 [Phycisphaerae bacterium]|jgi:hypothetical protein
MKTQQKIKYISLGECENIAEISEKFNEIIQVVNQLAPALPEDEECEVIEVVKIPEFYIDELNLTKPDGKWYNELK